MLINIIKPFFKPTKDMLCTLRFLLYCHYSKNNNVVNVKSFLVLNDFRKSPGSVMKITCFRFCITASYISFKQNCSFFLEKSESYKNICLKN